MSDRRWIVLSSLSLWLLTAYALVVLWWKETLFGVAGTPMRFTLLCLVGLGAVHWLVSRLRRSDRVSRETLMGLTAGAVATTGALICADVGYSVYLNARGVGSSAQRTIEASRFHDRFIWAGEAEVPAYYPTARDFQLLKPGMSSSASQFGDLYFEGMSHVRLLVDSVLTRRVVVTHVDERGARETTPFREARVIALGDSFTYGSGTTQERTWVEVLEALSGQPTYNLGLPGDSPAQELRRLEYLLDDDSGPEGPVSVLWMIFEGNDLEDMAVNPGGAAPSAGPDGVARLASGTVVELVDQVLTTVKEQSVVHRIRTGQLTLAGRDAGSLELSDADLPAGPYILARSERFGWRLFDPDYARRATNDRSDIVGHPGARLLEETFDEMRALAAEHDLRVTVVLAPSAARLHADQFQGLPRPSDEPYFLRHVESLARDSGFGIVALHEVLAPFAREELLYWRDDTHWNERGHELVASLLADVVLAAP